MQKCLGMYIESNIIKYAKVSRDKNDMKIECSGIRFYENDLNAEIKKIVEETYSFNTPISINLKGEQYLYFDIFALLNKKDIEKTVETEFDTYCEEKKYNPNAFETRYALTTNTEDKEKFRAMNIFINKLELNRQIQPVEKYKLARIVPEAIAIGNIAKIKRKENQLIVNMEEETTITHIVEQQIYDIETIEAGSKEVLENINKEENSYAKSYEICKNTTIYVAELDTAEVSDQPYLQTIMPTVYKIAQRVQEIVAEEPSKYQKVYLTGTLAVVNNIDLYFQEFLPNIECEILKPKFLTASAKVNIKEYIEVNSAIALATNELGEGVQELNFRKQTFGEKAIKALNIEMPEKQKASKFGTVLTSKVNFDFKGKLDRTETWFARGTIALILVLIIFSVFSKALSNSMLNKEEEIDAAISAEQTQIGLATADSTSLESKTSAYESLISDLEEMDEKASEIAASKNLIPNLLSQIMYVIPDKVQITSIENTEDDTIQIQAQSSEYDQLGYFIAILKNKKILTDVVSSSGLKSDGQVSVTIEGELP